MTVTRRSCSVKADGTKWEEDCNTCYCSNGNVVCTAVCRHNLTLILNLKKKKFKCKVFDYSVQL